ncbi:hypothetical protein [Nocardia crassostreae]|uniref:hypothetical protein n=1 Tax=Nocardia crassostreae TaxID=53428 RepID=UPI00082D4D9E|nr:hypothetical protein [Nocardia crassostreae]
MQGVFWIALGVLLFVMGPALAVVMVAAVRRSARQELAARRSPTRNAARMPVAATRATRH